MDNQTKVCELLLMNWREVCEKPELKDLPYRIELNELGQIVMSPASNEHSFRQSKLIREMLRCATGGEVLPECSINTEDGTKVADVVWFSDEFLAEHGLATPFPNAPEVCVEILSPSNSEKEMERKRQLYFDRGAREVWLCEAGGKLRFYANSGLVDCSEIFADFPDAI
ncbi:MAG: Uma2 family endonuclease [Verrucomicrobiota bacterium]